MPSILLGLGIWYGVEPVENLTPTSVHLLAVFVRYVSGWQGELLSFRDNGISQFFHNMVHGSNIYLFLSTLSTSVIFALLTTNCEMSLIAALALAVLSFTRSFKCETEDGLSIECSRCGSLKPGSSEEYQCDGYEGAFKQALVGYSNEVNWLIFCAFHLGHAVEITLLGKRLSLMLIKYIGSSVLGLGYAIAISGAIVLSRHVLFTHTTSSTSLLN